MHKKILKLVSALAVLGIVAPNFSLAIETKPELDQKEQWQYYKDVNINGNPQKGELVKITLDQEILSSAKQDLGDLRVMDNNLIEVPYKLIVERSIFAKENIYPIVVLNNYYNSDKGYNIFVIDFGQNNFSNSYLNILTNSENFRRTVEISGGDDLANWNILKSNGYIYDYTDRVAGFKAQNTRVNYPENTFRYIQVKIFTGGEIPLSINGAQISRITKKESRETVFNPKYEVMENSVKKTTEIIVDLEKKGWPTSNITLVSPDENFNREVVVYESSDKNKWRMVGQSYIFNYNTPKFVGANLEVDYSETNERYLKLEIFNGDDRPISVAGMFAKTILRSIAFQYGINTSGKVYKLYYGNPRAIFPQYDLEKFFPYLDTGIYFSSSLSIEQINPVYQKEIPPALPITERIPYLLPVTLVSAISMMGLMVLKFIKKVSADR